MRLPREQVNQPPGPPFSGGPRLSHGPPDEEMSCGEKTCVLQFMQPVPSQSQLRYSGNADDQCQQQFHFGLARGHVESALDHSIE